MSVVIWPMKIYKVVSGSEQYLWDQDWYVTGSVETDQHSNYQETPEGAMAEIGAPFISHFYLGNVTGINMGGFGRLIDGNPFTPEIGNPDIVIRAYLKNDDKNRMIEITFHRVNSSTKSVNMTQAFFMNGVNKYSRSIFNMLLSDTTSRTSSPAFVVKDSNNHYHLQYLQGIGNYNSSINPYFFCMIDVNSIDLGVNPTGLIEWLTGYVPIIPDEDNPYWDGGTSGEGGGGGNFSEDSDTIALDNLPTLDAVGTGFATLFTPTRNQLSHLADIMWNNNIFAALQNLVENITNMFTGLSIVPFLVQPGSTVEVTWLGLPITEVYLTLAAKQFYEIDMGTINLADDQRINTTGSALDYSPFSKLGIYLPFIGFQELDIDECRGCVMGLVYRIDILSGTCVAVISLDGNNVYQYTGNCLTQIPITNESLESLVSDAVNVGIAISNTGATAATSAGEISETANSSEDLKFDDIANAHRKITNSEGQLASATANAMMGMKPTIKKSGAVSAAASLLSVKQPYLFLTTPRQSIPDFYQRYCGFPSNMTGKLNTFSGFTVVESIRLNGLVATSPEVAEIYDLLKKGVII